MLYSQVDKQAYEESWSLGDVTDRNVYEGSRMKDWIEDDDSEGVDFEGLEDENEDEVNLILEMQAEFRY